MRIAVVVPFLDEERHLGTLLESLSAQRRTPDRLVLVDDGSTDDSPAIASRFAAHTAYATVVRRPQRPAERDRMLGAHELRAFQCGVRHLAGDYDVVAKLDADLRLPGDFLATIERHFLDDPRLGMAGAYLSTEPAPGSRVRQRCPAGHVEGENTFYRRECLEEISPLPAILGWDTIDEVRARLRGWRTLSVEIPSGDPVHLRRMGSHDGVLRGYRRAGIAAYAYGAHPLHVLLGAGHRVPERPYLLCATNYLAGWGWAALRRPPRAEPEVRATVRREQLRRIRHLLSGIRA
jgi:poly-beta-1,6-N-acetyl-D-glucosamine synthase